VSGISVTGSDGCVRFAVRVQPRASRTEIVGEHGTALKVRLQAPPVDGAANEALIDFLAAELGVARRAVRVVSGQSSRAKTVEVEGVSTASIHSLAEGARKA
jgi:uncharacterized protein (TIGR00251 family)